MEYNEQKVDALITEDQRVMTREIVLQPHTGHNAMQVMLKTLKYQKLCHYWVSQLLMDKHERACTDVSTQLLQQHAAEDDDFLLNIVTGDESRFHHFDPKTKLHRMERLHAVSPKKKPEPYSRLEELWHS
jgi:hypothetical protein